MSMSFKMKNGREMIAFENVQLINRNMRGLIREYNKSGNRSFSIVLTPDEAEELSARGYNVRMRPSRDNPDDMFCFLSVFVSFNHIPPKIYRVSDDKMVLLSEENVGTLDTADIVSADVVVNASHWDINGRTGIKCYVNSMYVTVEEDMFAREYNGFTVIG